MINTMRTCCYLLAGATSFAISSQFNIAVGLSINSPLAAVLLIPFIEELVKLSASFLMYFLRRAYRVEIGFIIGGLFGIAEAVRMLLVGYNNTEGLLLRLCITVPMHISTAMISSKRAYYFPLAVLIHAFFNYLCRYGINTILVSSFALISFYSAILICWRNNAKN